MRIKRENGLLYLLSWCDVRAVDRTVAIVNLSMWRAIECCRRYTKIQV